MSKSIKLKPDWKRWFWGYFFGVLLIPFLGIGLIVLWKVHQKKKSYLFIITDRQITTEGEGLSQTVDLVNIKNLDVEQNWVDKKFNLGDITLSTGSRSVTLYGQLNPDAISESISKAIYSEQKRIKELNRTKEGSVEPPPPGTLDKLDYLTGLWQQGLMSDEDFKKEKKHFE